MEMVNKRIQSFQHKDWTIYQFRRKKFQVFLQKRDFMKFEDLEATGFSNWLRRLFEERKHFIL